MISDIKTKLEEPLLEGMMITESVRIDGYNVSATFTADADNKPSEYVKALVKQGYFENISYNGYEGMPEDPENENSPMTYTFSLTMLLKGGNGYEIKQ